MHSTTEVVHYRGAVLRKYLQYGFTLDGPARTYTCELPGEPEKPFMALKTMMAYVHTHPGLEPPPSP